VAWDASAPSTLGIDWEVATESVLSLSSPSTCAAWFVDSTVTETISTLYVPHTWTGASTGYGKLAVDVYNIADAGAGSTLTETRYQPNEDDSAVNMFGTSPAWTSLSAGSCYTKVDETTADDSDYLNFTWTSKNRYAFNTAAMSAALQVSEVKWEIRAFGYWGTTGSIYVDLYSNTTFVSRLGTITPPADSDDTHKNFRTYTVGPVTTNPLTGLAWTATDIINMDTGSNLMVQLTCDVGNVAVSWVSMVVTTGTDKRVAVFATATQTSKPSGTQTNLVCSPTANWSKTTGVDYLLVARRIDDPTGVASTLIPQPIYIDGEASPNTQGKAYSATIDSSGVLQSTGSASTTRTYPFWLGTSGGAISADSMPYWDLVLIPVYTGVGNVRQGFHNASAQAYKGIRFLVGYSGTPTANLTIEVRRVSDNVELGADATVTTTDVAAGTFVGTVTDSTYGDISIYSVLTNLSSSATLAGSVAYYFTFASSTTSGNPWLLVMLDAAASHSLTGNVTHGGATQQATAAGSAVAQGDFVCAIQSTITAPSSITVTATSTTVNGVSIQYADVDWVDGGAIGGTFDRWEVERSEDGGTVYTTIAYVETEATITFPDYEAPRGTACKYRVRKVRTDGAVSDWTTQSNTTTCTGTTGLTVFTSNAAPSLTCGYYVHGTDTAYRFNTAEETTFHRLHDRDYIASFKPLEQRGITWSFEASIHGGPTAPSAGEGVQTFTVLRNIAESTDVTYVCMHTGDGERFFGALQLHEGRRHNPAKIYTAQVTFTQTQTTSSAVTV
jgi:hypothetical protein